MFILIPKECIALIMFPGVIIHEIAHRLFCDFYNIPVYKVSYLNIFSKNTGHVLHQKTENSFYKFFIGMAPLFINTLLCMLFTFPLVLSSILKTDFLHFDGNMSYIIYVMAWLGFTIGFQAIPSNQDIAPLKILAKSWPAKIGLGIITLMNVELLGILLTLLYLICVVTILPGLFLYSIGSYISAITVFVPLCIFGFLIRKLYVHKKNKALKDIHDESPKSNITTRILRYTNQTGMIVRIHVEIINESEQITWSEFFEVSKTDLALAFSNTVHVRISSPDIKRVDLVLNHPCYEYHVTSEPNFATIITEQPSEFTINR